MGRSRNQGQGGMKSIEGSLEALMAAMKAISTRISPKRLDEVSAKLLSREVQAMMSPGFSAAALALVADLALFTAPPGRSTAVERHTGQARPPAGSTEAAVLAAMAGHRFVLFTITGTVDGGRHPARDLLTGEEFTLVTFGLDPIAEPGARVAGRLVDLNGVRVLISAAALLDDEALATVRPWLSRDGRSLANPQRCAEALYRQAIAEMRVVLPGVFGGVQHEEMADPDDVFHEIAAAWASETNAPSAEQEKIIRGRTSLDDLIIVIQYLRVAREARNERLSAAYERIAVLQLETLHRRAAVGNASSAETLEAFEAEINRAIAAREIPPLYRDLFRELDRRARPAAGRAATDEAGAELDRLRARIQALRAKTVEQGCTEQEALAAAAKVAELLDRHGLSLSELEMRQQACEGTAIETGRKRRAPIDDAVPVVARFCDCRYWIETGSDGELRFVFFGLPADVVAARCLYDLIAEAVAVETAAFKAGPLYADHHSNQRASATRSFQAGMVHEIAGKLADLKRQRSQTTLKSSGRDLVPLKADIVEEELRRLGMRFTEKTVQAGRSVLKDAYHAGRVAGQAFELEPKIDGGTPTSRR